MITSVAAYIKYFESVHRRTLNRVHFKLGEVGKGVY